MLYPFQQQRFSIRFLLHKFRALSVNKLSPPRSLFDVRCLYGISSTFIFLPARYIRYHIISLRSKYSIFNSFQFMRAASPHEPFRCILIPPRAVSFFRNAHDYHRESCVTSLQVPTYLLCDLLHDCAKYIRYAIIYKAPIDIYHSPGAKSIFQIAPRFKR